MCSTGWPEKAVNTSAALQEVAFRLPGPLQDLRWLHRAVWSAVRRQPLQTRDFLFAFAEQSDTIGIVVRSRRLPGHLARHAHPLAAPPAGDQTEFVLRANPVARVFGGHKPVARALLDPEELLGWLCAQGERHGFEPQPGSLTLTRRGRRCTSSQGQSFIVNDVVFRGALRVVQTNRFQRALEAGMGRSRAFGYGMLLLSAAP